MTPPVQFGDTLPPPPEDTDQPVSSHALGRFGHGLREALLRTFNPPNPPLRVPPPEEVRRLLVVQNERLGELVLAEPALRGLRTHYSEAERVLIAPEFAEDLFGGTGWGSFRSPSALKRLSKESPAFDLAVDLTVRPEIRVAQLLARGRIRHQIGFERGGRGVYATVPVPFPPITMPMREVYLQINAKLDAMPDDSIPRLPRGGDRLERGYQAWRNLELRDPVVLMPGAHNARQRWPVKAFAMLGQALRRQDIPVAVICGPGEEQLGKAVASSVEAPLCPAPMITELMDMIACSRLVVCNNSGPLHLAAALGVPTISTMGPTAPWRWWPVSDASAIVFRGESNGAEGDFERIDPLEVAAAALHLLETA